MDGMPEDVLGRLGVLGMPEELLGMLGAELGMLGDELGMLGIPEDDEELEELWQPLAASAATPSKNRAACLVINFKIASGVVMGFLLQNGRKSP